MGIVYTPGLIQNPARRIKSVELPKMLVDTGSKLTWVPSPLLEGIGIRREKKDVDFEMANGRTIARSIGFAIVCVGDTFTIDEVVYGEEGDQVLLGARSLEGLKLTVDPAGRRLVAAGPHPAARSS